MFATRSFSRMLLPVILAVVVAEGSLATPPHRPAHISRDSFSPHPVNSIDELVAAVRKNAALRHLYARHFGISEAQVVDFFGRALVVYRLPQARNVTVYGVTKNGHIYPVQTRLRAGEQVWATRSGLPVLRWRCANPFSTKLPGTLLPSPPRHASHNRVPRGLPRNPLLPQLALVGTEQSNVEPALPRITEPAGGTSALQLPPSGLSGSGDSNVPIVFPPQFGSHIGLPLFLPLLPLAASIGGPSTIPVPPINPPPIVVAEPDTRGLLGEVFILLLPTSLLLRRNGMVRRSSAIRRGE